MKAFASATCYVGAWDDVWHADGRGTVVFPPGFKPQQLTFKVASGNFIQADQCGDDSTVVH